MTGFTSGGDKIRKLEYLLADAKAKRCDTLVTQCVFQSNHCRSTALLGNKIGFKTSLLLLGSPLPFNFEGINCLDTSAVEDAVRRRHPGGKTEGWVTGLRLAFGSGYFVNEKILVYVEPSWAGSMGNEDRPKPWAAEGGIQYQGPRDMWKNSTAYYAAAHVRPFDETSWDPGVRVQTGFHVKRDQRSDKLRLGLEEYIGLAILDEFALDYDEAYLTAGTFFDFY